MEQTLHQETILPSAKVHTLTLRLLVHSTYTPLLIMMPYPAMCVTAYRIEENLSSPPLHEHSTELAEITAGYKVWWLVTCIAQGMWKTRPRPILFQTDEQEKHQVLVVLTITSGIPIDQFSAVFPCSPSCQDSLSTCATLTSSTLCPQLRALASTSVRMNTWSMLWQSMYTRTPMMSCLCGCTLHLSFQNNTLSTHTCISWRYCLALSVTSMLVLCLIIQIMHYCTSCDDFEHEVQPTVVYIIGPAHAMPHARAVSRLAWGATCSYH